MSRRALFGGQGFEGKGFEGKVFEAEVSLAETEPMVRAAKALDQLGLDALEKASLFGNVTALFAQKAGLGRQRFLRLCAELYDVTTVQRTLLDEPTRTSGGVA